MIYTQIWVAELFYYIPNKDELFENLNEYYKEDVKTKGIITKPTKVRPEFKIEISEIYCVPAFICNLTFWGFWTAVEAKSEPASR